MSLVNIVDVSSRDLAAERLWGCHIDLPVPGSQTEIHTIDVLGWVLGRNLPTVAVEILSEGTVLSRVPINAQRPDIAVAFPQAYKAEWSGFQITLNLSELESRFTLPIQAVFEDGSRVQLGVIRGQGDSTRGETTIEEVWTNPTDLSAPLWGCHIDFPDAGSQTDIYAISVEGWALGRNFSAVAVELVSDNAVFRRIPIDIDRPDIATQYAAVLESTTGGFRATVNVLGLKPEFELFVRVILQDESRIPIGVIRATRHQLCSGFKPKLQPLMVTTYGRTGSTWLMQLLGKHPKIVAYRPFEYEPRVSSYWMQVLKTLSEPASYFQTLATELNHDLWWLGDDSALAEQTIPDSRIQKWLGRRNIEESAAFCQQRIEKFYEQVAVVQGRADVVYFAEKQAPTRFDHEMFLELYPQAREIMLVRDFRDMICSILAYSIRQQRIGFGRERVNSDEEFIWQIRTAAVSLLHYYKERSADIHLVRYEDLVLHPEHTLSSILEFLELNSMPSTAKSMTQTDLVNVSSTQQHRTSSNPKASIGRWRRDLDSNLLATCQEALGEVLKEFGYED